MREDLGLFGIGIIPKTRQEIVNLQNIFKRVFPDVIKSAETKDSTNKLPYRHYLGDDFAPFPPAVIEENKE